MYNMYSDKSEQFLHALMIIILQYGSHNCC